MRVNEDLEVRRLKARVRELEVELGAAADLLSRSVELTVAEKAAAAATLRRVALRPHVNAMGL